MDGGSGATQTSLKFDLWKRLLDEQTVLFQKTVTENGALESRVEELERELSVWKIAFKTADEERLLLRTSVSKLERNIGSLKEDNPLLLCLIDGDGNIFSQDHIKLGQAGGRQAAMLLTRGLTDHAMSLNEGSTGRGQVWLTVYCNKTGLLDTLTSANICTAAEFEAFVLGFNQASPLFSISDVGSGKEAADAKIKECLRVFTRFPQISKVFFGGGHDNGYTSTLNSLENEGFLGKVVLLRGYKDLAVEIKNLELPELDIEGIFMPRRLPPKPKKYVSPPPNVPVQPHDFEKFRESYKPPPPRALKPHLSLAEQNPPPCNFHYLMKCRRGAKCQYGHDYALSPEDISVMRTNARKSPCPHVNKNKVCPNGDDNCCSGHFCPRGPKCSYFKQGKCKFIGRDMHKRRPVQRESSSEAASSISDGQVLANVNSTPFLPPIPLSPVIGLSETGGSPKKPSLEVPPASGPADSAPL